MAHLSVDSGSGTGDSLDQGSNKDNGVFTRERLLTIALAILTFLALYVCYRIIEPFIPPMAFALALAVATNGPFDWLRRKLGKETLAATVAVILVAVLLVVPAAFLTTYIVQIAIEQVTELQKGGGAAHVREVLERQPYIGPLAREASARFRLEEQIGNIGSAVASRASGILSGSVGVLTQLGVMLFVLFFLYRDEQKASRALRKLLPLSTVEVDRLYERVGSTISATVNGSLTVGLLQAVLAGIVYACLGIPAAVLWGSATFIAALIPVAGTPLVWAPIAAYLALTGSVGKAIFLVVWGALVVGSMDNFVYPYLVGGKLRLHTVPTFFSVLGGIALFGPVGIILGPITLAIALALLDVWFQRTEEGQAAEHALAPKAEEKARPSSSMQEHPI